MKKVLSWSKRHWVVSILFLIPVLSFSWTLINYCRGVVTTVNHRELLGFTYHTPPRDFIGSPHKQSSFRQRSHLDLEQNGWFVEKFFKLYRSSAWLEIGPGLIFLNFPIHVLTGWDIYNHHDAEPVLKCEPRHNSHLIKEESCHCAIGRVSDLRISAGDGDINFFITLEPKFQYLVEVKRWHFWTKELVEKDMDLDGWPKLLNEIDEPLRPNFPVLFDLRNDDCVKVCGQWVFDRAHPHNELHPATWLEMVPTGWCARTTN